MCRTSSDTCRAPSAALFTMSVDDFAIDPLPQDGGRAVDQRLLTKILALKFIDVVVCAPRLLIKAAEAFGDLLWQDRVCSSKEYKPATHPRSATATETPMRRSSVLRLATSPTASVLDRTRAQGNAQNGCQCRLVHRPPRAEPAPSVEPA